MDLRAETSDRTCVSEVCSAMMACTWAAVITPALRSVAPYRGTDDVKDAPFLRLRPFKVRNMCSLSAMPVAWATS